MLREKLLFSALLATPLATLAYFAVAFGFGAAFWTWLAAITVLGMAVAAIVRWHARNVAYRCGNCDVVFTIDPFIDFTSPHLPGRKHLRCPRCGRRSWCEELERQAAAPPPVNPPSRTIGPGRPE